MAATTNGAGIARIARGFERFEQTGEATGYAQSAFLDELPGVAFGLITLAYIVTTLIGLL